MYFPTIQLSVIRRAAVLTVIGFAGAAQAQAPTPGTETSLAAAPTLPTRLHYQSVLGHGAATGDPKPENWMAANDRVGAIGGWRAYAREVMTGVPAGKALDGETAQPAGAVTGMQMPMHMKGHGQ